MNREQRNEIRELWTIVDSKDDNRLSDKLSEIKSQNIITSHQIKDCLLTIVYLSYIERLNKISKSNTLAKLPDAIRQGNNLVSINK